MSPGFLGSFKTQLLDLIPALALHPRVGYIRQSGKAKNAFDRINRILAGTGMHPLMVGMHLFSDVSTCGSSEEHVFSIGGDGRVRVNTKKGSFSLIDYKGFMHLPFDKRMENPEDIQDLAGWNALKALTLNQLKWSYGHNYEDWLLAIYQPATSAQRDALIDRYKNDVGQSVNFLTVLLAYRGVFCGWRGP